MCAEECWVAVHLDRSDDPVFGWIVVNGSRIHHLARLSHFKRSEVHTWVVSGGGSYIDAKRSRQKT